MIAHLIWSTATAVVAIAAVFALRKRTAGLRFTILLIAVLRFAIPTPWLSDVGIKLGGYVPLAVMEDLSAFLRHPGDAALPAMNGNVRFACPSRASRAASVKAFVAVAI